jgi:hypothetical protein
MVEAHMCATDYGDDRYGQARADWEAMLAAAPPVVGWQDISTAPRDGTVFLARSGDWTPFECEWDGERFVHMDPEDGPIAYKPAQWHPLNRCPTCNDFGFLDAPHPPSVSTGPRPQEAVPTETVIDRWADLERLAKAAAKRAPGLWGSDIEKSEGEYGVGDECHSGFMVPYMETEHGKRLFDAHYCDVAEVHVDYDEDGAHAWDEAAREIFNYLAAVQPSAVLELIAAARPQPADGCSSNEGAAIWITHDGGPNPVGHTDVVEARRRDGSFVTKAAFKFDWSHDQNRVGILNDRASDIIAYRILTQTEKGS